MEKKKGVRILALIGAILLAALYVSTLVFALLDNPFADKLLIASVAGTILIPALIYASQLIYKILKKDTKSNNKR